MTDTRPSPAPWAYEYSPYTIGAAGDREIAVEARELPAYEIFDADGTKLFDTNEDTDGALQEANARLATAAPAMLEALRLAQRALNTAPRFRVGDTDSYKIAAVVERVIAKANAA